MQDDPEFSRLRFKTAEGTQIILDDANERIYISTSVGRTWLEMDKDGHINVFGANSISVRSGADLNFFADGDINLEAVGGINMKADTNNIMMTSQTDIQIQANGDILAAACGIFDIDSEDTIHLTSKNDTNIHANAALMLLSNNDTSIKANGSIKFQGTDSISAKGGTIVIGGSSIDLNGGGSIKASAGTIDLNSGGADSPDDAETAEDATCPDQASSPTVVPNFEPWTRPESDAERNPNWNP
jgi:uncharacterized protein (DUF2345 family)